MIDHAKVEFTKLKNVDGELALDFPVTTMNASDFPAITVITVTKNRKKFFPLAINNWKRIYYPHDKLTWLVVDDSENVKDGPVELLKALKDSRVKYYYLKPEEGKSYNVGYKRNFAMGLVTTDYVVNFDDDDFFYAESIISRVCALKFYGKECVYSDSVGVYNTKHESSYILEGFSNVPEGTMMYTKSFWEKRKYGEDHISDEGVSLTVGREPEMLRIPYFFNMIVINHSQNTTGKLRNVKFKKTGEFKTIKSTVSSINFRKFMDKDFLKELEKI